MIDVSHEDVISLTDATKFLPPRRAGKRPHVATLHRWVTVGVRGIKLEMIQVGGTRCTSREALQRFFDRLTAGPTTPTATTTKRRTKEVSAAKAELAAAGY